MKTGQTWHIEADMDEEGKHELHNNRFIYRDNGDIVCSMRDQATQAIDARLISAAPELLAACKMQVELDELKSKRNFAEAQSKKSHSMPYDYLREKHQEYLELASQVDVLIDKVDLAMRQAIDKAEGN